MSGKKLTTARTGEWFLCDPMEIDPDVRELAYLQSIREEVGKGHVLGERRKSLATYARGQLAFQAQLKVDAEESVSFWRDLGKQIAKQLEDDRAMVARLQEVVAGAEKRQRDTRSTMRRHRAEMKRAAQMMEAYAATLAALETAEGESC